IPTNLLLTRLGPKIWLPLITATWGAVSMASAAVIRGPLPFYLMRVLLGAAESGCFPGMWWTCEQFYPPSHITFAYSALEAAIAVAQIVAAPFAAALLAADGVAGLEGWQALFLAQGAITVAFAGLLYARLPNGVATAAFLDNEDRAWIARQRALALQAALNGADQLRGAADGQCKELQLGELARGAAPQHAGSAPEPSGAAAGDAARLLPAAHADSSGAALPVSAAPPVLAPLAQVAEAACNPRLWYLVALKVLKDVSLDSLVYWTPVLIHALLEGGTVSLGVKSDGDSAGERCGGKNAQLRAVLLSLVPFGLAAAATLAIGHSSERSGERRRHIGLPLLCGGVAFGLMPAFLHLGQLAAAFACVAVAVIAADATTGPFWSLVLSAARPGTSAVALAAVNSLGKLGGAAGPASFGLLSYYTGSLRGPILFVACALLGAGVLALAYRHDYGAPRHDAEEEVEAPLQGPVVT
ncbi:hypothetical protein Rsub_11673, partial [Raphidocelis subcapitata]